MGQRCAKGGQDYHAPPPPAGGFPLVGVDQTGEYSVEVSPGATSAELMQAMRRVGKRPRTLTFVGQALDPSSSLNGYGMAEDARFGAHGCDHALLGIGDATDHGFNLACPCGATGKIEFLVAGGRVETMPSPDALELLADWQAADDPAAIRDCRHPAFERGQHPRYKRRRQEVIQCIKCKRDATDSRRRFLATRNKFIDNRRQ